MQEDRKARLVSDHGCALGRPCRGGQSPGLALSDIPFPCVSPSHSADPWLWWFLEGVGGVSESGCHAEFHQLSKWNQHHPGALPLPALCPCLMLDGFLAVFSGKSPTSCV